MKPAFLALAAAGLSVAQAQEPPAFRSTTRLVQINVVVQGKNGPVPDLKREDFTVLDQGRPQKIAFFAVQNTHAPPTRPIKLPPHIFSNRFGDKAEVPPNVTVILLDALNTSWQSQLNARSRILKFLGQIQPQDRVALYVLNRGLRVMHDFTSDSTALIEKLKKWSGEIPPDESPGAFFGLSGNLAMAHTHAADFMTENRIMNTLQAIEAISEHLAGVPGRKNLIWVSGGFPLTLGLEEVSTMPDPGSMGVSLRDKRTFFEQIERVTRALNHANAAVYPVDARGLMTDSAYSARNSGMPSRGGRLWKAQNTDTMAAIAEQTGGKAFYDRNDIDGAVREVFTHARITYTLGYYPTENDSRPRYREIKVKVNRPGVSVRHRNGYFPFTEVKETDTKTEIANAVWSPLDATAVGLNARVDLIKDKGAFSLYVQIDPTTITLTQTGDHWQGRLDFAFVQKSDDGKQVGGTTEIVHLNLTRDTYLDLMKKGLTFHRNLPYHTDAKVLRIVAVDAPSGLAGALSIPIDKVAAN